MKPGDTWGGDDPDRTWTAAEMSDRSSAVLAEYESDTLAAAESLATAAAEESGLAQVLAGSSGGRIHLIDGQSISGRWALVGADALIVDEASWWSAIPLSAVAEVVTAAVRPRPEPVAALWRRLLRQMVDHGEQVSLWTLDGSAVAALGGASAPRRGRVERLGSDYLQFRSDAGDAVGVSLIRLDRVTRIRSPRVA